VTEAFYAIIIIAFASLGVLTMFNHLVRGNEIRENIRELGETVDSLEEKIAAARLELQDMSFESSILNEERVALEAQGKCLIELEESHRQKFAKEGGRR
jgi:cell division protein FtsL